MLRLRNIAVLLALGALAVPALAHDFWLEPARFGPRTDEPVLVGLSVGHAWAGEPVARRSARIATFTAWGPSGAREIPGLDGRAPAGVFRASESGVHVLVYESRPEPVELGGPAFLRYLREEGLDRVLRERRERGLEAAPARERFTRCAKALVVAGDAPSVDGFDRRVGLPLEIVPERAPFALAATELLPLVVLHEGAPADGVLVVAWPAERPTEPLSARTDAAGRVRLALPVGGRWMVKATHMVASARPDVEWESFWASLTFAVDREAAPATGVRGRAAQKE